MLQIVVATGFIAKSPAGQATTLRRNGSDLSATILGSLFLSAHITIWTDVDGVYSVDPRKVPEAVCLSSLTYHEAWELSYFGANVLHPRTTLPAMKYHIPITIRNFFNLAAPGERARGTSRGQHQDLTATTPGCRVQPATSSRRLSSCCVNPPRSTSTSSNHCTAQALPNSPVILA